MRRLPRWLLFTAFVLVLVVGGLSSLAVFTVRQPLPQTEGRLALPVLKAPVEVLRDASGVPQIYADNAEDLFVAQGFVHAQDRFFEMDVRRHITAGRLSEMFGPSQVATDAAIQTMGWRRVAQAELALLSPSTRRYLDAYASGVNAYLHSHTTDELSLEYSLLALTGGDYVPEDWTAVDSIAWLKAMAWDLGSNRSDEAERALLTTLVGAQRAEQLFPSHSALGFDPILGNGAVVDGRFDPHATASARRPLPQSLQSVDLAASTAAWQQVAALDQIIPPLVGDPASGAVGSNSWAVSGAHTTTGGALLSNDPHLATSIPSVFVQVGLHCRVVNQQCPFDVSGFSFSGMPGVIIGHNQRVAWGFTTSYPDVEDLYLEQVRGNTVRVGDSYQPLETRTEQLKVKGEEEPRTIVVRSSRHGPLISDVDDQLRSLGEQVPGAPQEGYAVALDWVALRPGRTMDALFALNLASNFDEFRAAASLLSAPSQNMIYADVDGNIGYQLPGDIPIRGRGLGLTPSPGWDVSYDWTGMIPFDALPYAYNPPSGYLVAANQPTIDQTYPYHLGSGYSYGWRSQQLIDQLGRMDPISPEQAEQLFSDTTIRFAEELTPVLLKIKIDDPWVREGQQTLLGWDYTSLADSAPAAYFNVVLHEILQLTVRDELPAELWPRISDRWEAVITQLLKLPNDPWWDDKTTPVVETRDDILLAAMTQARKNITAMMARDPQNWAWGKIHRVTLRHQTLGSSGITIMEKIFNRGDYPAGGGPAVVLALASGDSDGYRVTTGPAMRMLVDLADLDQSRWINQSGASGHAFDRHYDDQTELWITNQLLPFSFTRERVEQATVDRLLLVPSA